MLWVGRAYNVNTCEMVHFYGTGYLKYKGDNIGYGQNFVQCWIVLAMWLECASWLCSLLLLLLHVCACVQLFVGGALLTLDAEEVRNMRPKLRVMLVRFIAKVRAQMHVWIRNLLRFPS